MLDPKDCTRGSDKDMLDLLECIDLKRAFLGSFFSFKVGLFLDWGVPYPVAFSSQPIKSAIHKPRLGGGRT